MAHCLKSVKTNAVAKKQKRVGITLKYVIMKKQFILLVALMSLITVSANTITKSNVKIGVNNRYDDAVTFIERGIKFHIFLNGDFDFNTHSRYNYRKRGRDYGVRIERNYKGQIRRVGNVFINYDHRGNVKRIGNVFINYRFGQLSRVGNLTIEYDRWGNPFFRGSVKRDRYYYDNEDYDDYNDSCDIKVDVNIRDVYDYDDVYFYRNSFKTNYRQVREDNDYYYYRALPSASIGNRNQIIKRRKQKTKLYRKNDRRRR